MKLIAISVLILCIKIIGDEQLAETIRQANEVGLYYSYEENNRNTVGILLSFGALAMMHLGLNNRKVWFIPMIIAIALGLVTGSRKVVFIVSIGATVYVLIYALYVRGKTTSRKNISLFFVLLAVIIMLYACFEIPQLYNIIGNRLEGMFGVLKGTGQKEASARIRAEMIEKAMEMFKEKPLLGWGIDGFERYGGFQGAYSHNNYTETLVSFGLVGFVLIYSVRTFLTISQFIMIRRKKHSEIASQHIIVFALMIVSFIIEFAAISMNSVVMNIMFAMAAAQQYTAIAEKEVIE